jgi:hypothetical protein
MAIDRPRRSRRAKLVRKKNGLAQAPDYNPPGSGSGLARVNPRDASAMADGAVAPLHQEIARDVAERFGVGAQGQE